MENGIPGKLRPWELGHVDLKTATIAAQNLVTADRDHQDHDELRFLYTNPQIQVILCEINIFCHQLTPNNRYVCRMILCDLHKSRCILGDKI